MTIRCKQIFAHLLAIRFYLILTRLENGELEWRDTKWDTQFLC